MDEAIIDAITASEQAIEAAITWSEQQQSFEPFNPKPVDEIEREALEDLYAVTGVNTVAKTGVMPGFWRDVASSQVNFEPAFQFPKNGDEFGPMHDLHHEAIAKLTHWRKLEEDNIAGRMLQEKDAYIAKLEARAAERDATIRRLANENAALRYLVDEVRSPEDDATLCDGDGVVLSRAMRASPLMRFEDDDE